MIARNPTDGIPWTTTLQATLIFLVSVALSRGILVAQQRAPEAALPAAIVLAIGAMGTAATLWRHTFIPRWSRFASAGAIAFSLVAAAWIAPEAVVRRGAEPWMLPWFLLVLGTVIAARRSVCASVEVTGRVVFGVSAGMGLVSVVAAYFGHAI